MTIQQCKYILAIARSGSMNEAAKSLLVSQASLSSAVRELEDEFNIRIFDRSNKGVRITKDGSEFIRYARQLLAQYEVITDRYQGEDKKSIRNFAVTSQHYDFVAEAFVVFMKKFRVDFNLSLKEARTFEVIDDVTNLRSDVGILAYLKAPTGGYMERYLKRNGLDYHQLFETSPHVFLGKHHPLADRDQLTLEELAEYPYITYDQGETGPIEFSEELTESNPTKKHIRINDRATLMNLLLSTDSYTIGTGVMTSDLNKGSVVSVKLASGDVYSVVLINRADVGLSEDAEKFIRVLHEVTSKISSHDD
ncbi:MAG: LysR family transcriptional regulator [Clostridia bacterium]|nr:LysR family transcriptional regulator [Clostridia bacterium]